MPQELLGNYAVKKNLNTNFRLSFDIPDNCNYTTSIDNQVNLVTITMNEGVKDPSSNYIKYDIDYSMIDNLLTIQFEQQDLTAIENLVYVKKPRVIVSNDVIQTS